MIKQTSYKIKVNGKPKTIDTVIDTELKLENKSESKTSTLFEPRTCNRFVVKLTDKHNKEIIPYYLIKQINRPIISNSVKNNLYLIIYDIIALSAFKLLLPYVEKQININVYIFGPVGDSNDIVETWTFKDAKLKQIIPGDLSWANDNISEIQLLFDVTKNNIIIK